MGTPNPSSLRVLIRPPKPIPTPQPSTVSLSPPIPPDHHSLPPLPPPPSNLPPPPPPPQPQPPSTGGGVVVVGFIGRREGDVTQLINRVIDSNVFGSGNFDKDFSIEKEGIDEEMKNWFRVRRVSYYHDDEKGILYLQFSSTRCPMVGGFSESSPGFDSVLEEHEFGDLQGMLFMFSVCHVIIFIQEGSRLDTQILKQFRILQAAKQAMSPSVRSRTTPPLTSRSQSSPSSSRTSVSGTSSNHPSPGRSSGILSSRNASQISLMSGLGSYASLFPGQCTPVTLFVFFDDITDVNSGSTTENTIESSVDPSSSLNTSARPKFPMKGSGPVVVLARPVSKSEGGFRKKLQSSLEGQLRFSIKKCRTLTGSETSHAGNRSGGVSSSSAPLFSLDASKAVALLDRYSNQRGESLDFATDLVDEVLSGKATSDSLLLETHNQSGNNGDILSVKEFIYRQSDILRGRGGIVANTNSGSAGGVGMVAVAAAAAAASAASGKTFTTPELPSLEIWLSSSQLILQGILSAKHGCSDEPETSKRKSLDIAISCLESGRGLNTKFSTAWCETVLPGAKDIYLKELPACYPTSQHEAHMEKALRTFHSMVKGPAVPLFMKKLEDECTSIWRSGRQLCDAVSLTGRPCMHQRHDVEAGGAMQHSSGFIFLHACACGRSRKSQSDPFDFETANATNCFLDCDKLLPAVQLPLIRNTGPIQASSWWLIRVGGSRYYEPSKGLIQSGFCVTQKFLLKWTIFLEKQTDLNGPTDMTSVLPKIEPIAGEKTKKSQNGVEIQSELSSENIISDDKKISAGRGIPNFTMKKPFSEVVAGSATADSGFPPLQSKKQISRGSERGIKQSSIRDKNSEQVHETANYQGSQKSEDVSAVPETVNGNPFLQIGSNIVPVSMNDGEKTKLNTSLKHVIAYVGFEHECPRGHRFVLTPEHLSELGSPYSLPEESLMHSYEDNLDTKVSHPSKMGKNGVHGKAHRNLNGRIATTVGKLRKIEKSKESLTNSKLYIEDRNSMLSDSLEDLEAGLHSFTLDDGGSAFTLLNRNLPIYMNCPHCRSAKNQKDAPQNIFAGTVSQLQRIFLVTPPFPVILAACPIVQFEPSCLPPSGPGCEKKLQFSLGCRVILPPESFLSLRLPFVYGVQLEDGTPHPLQPFEHRPELTAWITKGTTLQVISKGSSLDEGLTK